MGNLPVDNAPTVLNPLVGDAFEKDICIPGQDLLDFCEQIESV